MSAAKMPDVERACVAMWTWTAPSSCVSVVDRGRGCRRTWSLRLPDEVEQREEVDPHEVDEVPVEGAEVDRGEVLRRERALACS